MASSITRMSIHPDDLGFTYNEQIYSGFEEFQYGSDNLCFSYVAEQGGWKTEGGTTSQLDTAAGMETEELFDFV
ncbi:hypothetical protein Tco_0533372 [Tanacetum coccineum]